jgi:hypothetical protein
MTIVRRIKKTKVNIYRGKINVRLDRKKGGADVRGRGGGGIIPFSTISHYLFQVSLINH